MLWGFFTHYIFNMPSFIKIINNKKFFILAFLLALILRFWGITSQDIQGDHALNASRALGWLDFLAGQGQTSPVIWFEANPWWGRLSFHDHPPLVFLIQRISFLIFGENSFAAFLPFALAGVGVTIIIFYMLKERLSEKSGILAMVLISVSSYSIWAARTGYLEGVQIFFIMLAVFFFIKFLEKQNPKFLYLWGVLVGLAILCKYTSLFLIPAGVVHLAIFKREVFRKKYFWLALVLCVAILTPVIIYNIEVFRYRGHFDAALSSMVGMNPKDYEVLSYRNLNANILGNIVFIFNIMRSNASLPFFIAEIIALGYVIFLAIKKKADLFLCYVLLNICFLIAMFSFSNPASRFLSIITPFLIIIFTVFIHDFWHIYFSGKSWKKYFVYLLFIIFLGEFFYMINTNIVSRPYGKAGVAYSDSRRYNQGFLELENYLKKNIFGELPKRQSIHSMKDLRYNDVKGRLIILFDERIDWFSRVWYIQRYQMYYNIPFISFTDLSLSLSQEENILEALRKTGAKDFWFIGGVGDGVASRDNKEYNNVMESFMKLLEESGIHFQKEIKDYKKDAVFTIYHFNLEKRV